MNELDVAKAIAAGEAPSPSRCKNAWLFDLRISGTGIAERPAHDETAYRPPEIWTGAEMVQRACGLPLILEHPDTNALTGQEFEARSIGTIVYPFVRDNELRGIGRIFDPAIAVAMASGDFSTSPCATYAKGANTTVMGTEGALLIEGSPDLLDHLAVIPNGPGGVGGGVWDKGGDAAGIRVDSTLAGAKTMADEPNTEAEPGEKKEADMGQLMETLTGIADMCKSLGSRMDALEKPKADAGAAEEKERKDTQERPGLVEKPSYSDDDAEAMADAQCKMDAAYSSHGRRAPRPMMGEGVTSFRVRGLRGLQSDSPVWKAANLAHLAKDMAALNAAEVAIIADSVAASRRPTSGGGRHQLREIKFQKGPHTIHEFVGHPGAWMDTFKRVNTRGTIRSLRSIEAA